MGTMGTMEHRVQLPELSGRRRALTFGTSVARWRGCWSWLSRDPPGSGPACPWEDTLADQLPGRRDSSGHRSVLRGPLHWSQLKAARGEGARLRIAPGNPPAGLDVPVTSRPRQAPGKLGDVGPEQRASPSSQARPGAVAARAPGRPVPAARGRWGRSRPGCHGSSEGASVSPRPVLPWRLAVAPFPTVPLGFPGPPTRTV